MDNLSRDQAALEELFDELGLDLLPPTERDLMVQKIGEVIFEGVMVRTVRMLDDEKKEELTALFEASSADPESSDKQSAIEAFLKTHVPDFEKYVALEIEALQNAPQDVYADREE